MRSTFFMIGRHVSRLPAIARAVAEAGHEVGNHTHTHPLLTLHFRNRAGSEIERCGHVLQEAVGRHSALFRPP